ncbi:MAG: hypothetical protein JXA46_02870 [Dehalococcoidales bacterium]|nr:hypothetical protein [Dehalococcoidales bacterium]
MKTAYFKLSGTTWRWVLMILIVLSLLASSFAFAMPVKADSGTVCMVADNEGYVHIFDADTRIWLGTVYIPGEDTIGDCSISSDGKLGFVTNFMNELYVIDLANIPLGLAPGINPIIISSHGEDISMTPDGQYIVIADGSFPDPVSVVNIAARNEVDTCSVGSDHNSVEVLSDSSVLVTSYYSNQVYRLTIDANGTLTDTGETLAFNDANNVYGSPDAGAGFVIGRFDNPVVQSFLVPGLTAVDTRNLTGAGICGAVHPDGDIIYIRTVYYGQGYITAYSFNSTTAALGANPLFSIPVSSCSTFYGMDQMAITPDGTRLFVPEGDEIKIYDADTGSLLHTISGYFLNDLTGICFGPKALARNTVGVGGEVREIPGTGAAIPWIILGVCLLGAGLGLKYASGRAGR